MQANEAIRGHHRDLVATLDGYVSALAAGRTDVEPAALVTFLKDDLVPHAQGEERHLYPAVEPLVREYGRATATMSVDHEFIEGYVSEIEKAVQAMDAGDAGEQSRARQRLERLVLQLQAVLEVHLEKEERIYLPLLEQYLSEEEQDKIVDRMHSAYG
ncbi:MAG TPA: hemerythrin domain-containing protein [Anaerolineae bacterium]|nr:hemerythrin domain-containing protein [Anaerolineae bacterium]